MHTYDRLMTQYLPILNAPTTFIAALDSMAIEHTLRAVRICGRAPGRMVSAAVGLAGRRCLNAQEGRGGNGEHPD
jgi:hypothetical protein